MNMILIVDIAYFWTFEPIFDMKQASKIESNKETIQPQNINNVCDT